MPYGSSLLAPHLSRLWAMLRPYYMAVVGVVGRFNARLILTVVFIVFLPIFVVIFGIRRMMRASRKDSSWVAVEPEKQHAYEHPF